jgi:glycosyltransferase involved in cell wall biosynthesis
VSEDSAASLREYWKWLGVPRTPVVQAIPSGVAPLPPGSDGNPPTTTVPRILCVGTIEGRKNHLALLEACESLWAASERFELELLGLARADTAARALARIQSLQQAGRPVSYRGAASDEVLQAAFRQCSFTVYPSLQEGFGLPVIESLQHGKPCICSGRGALGESAHGGGCLALDTVDAGSLAGAIRRLLQDRDEFARLTAAARGRRFKTWTDCARELSDWMSALPLRRNY